MTRTCPECGREFAPYRGGVQQFCTLKAQGVDHARPYYDRQSARFKTQGALFQTWRAGKDAKTPEAKARATFAFREMCKALDQWNAEDRAAGRHPEALVDAKMAGSWIFGDGPGWRAR